MDQESAINVYTIKHNNMMYTKMYTKRLHRFFSNQERDLVTVIV